MKTIALLIAIATLTPAQTEDSEKKVQFEVASIRPANQDGDHDSSTDKGFFRTHNLTLKQLIARAWEVNIEQIYGGPNWVDSDSYDISARIPEEFAQQRREKVPRMIQSLLADRFQLVIHREPRRISGYALVVAKKGSRMERAKPEEEGSGVDGSDTHLTAKNVTMEAFAKNLSRVRDVGKVVVDKTGLKGGFDFELDWIPEGLESRPEPSSEDHPSIFTALQDQLGLKLEFGKVSVLAIVIDSAKKPDGN